MEIFDLRLKAPSTAVVAGPTGSGKKRLHASLIANVVQVCYPPPREIIYCYGVWQKAFEEIKGVTFCEIMCDVKEKMPRDGNSQLIIVDDIMDEANGQTDHLYTMHSHHHLNISVFFMVQNLFEKTTAHDVT